MGLFAVVSDDDDVQACLSAVKVNIKLYEESIGGKYEEGSYYLLSLAQSALDQALLAHNRKHDNTISTQ